MKIQPINNNFRVQKSYLNNRSSRLTDPVPQTTNPTDSVSFHGNYNSKFTEVFSEKTNSKSSMMVSFIQLVKEAMQKGDYVSPKFKELFEIRHSTSYEALIKVLTDACYNREGKIISKGTQTVLAGGDGENLTFFNTGSSGSPLCIEYGLDSGKLFKSTSVITDNDMLQAPYMSDRQVYRNNTNMILKYEHDGIVTHYDENGEERVLRSLLSGFLGF